MNIFIKFISPHEHSYTRIYIRAETLHLRVRTDMYRYRTINLF